LIAVADYFVLRTLSEFFLHNSPSISYRVVTV